MDRKPPDTAAKMSAPSVLGRIWTMLPSYRMPMTGAWLVSRPISPSRVLAMTISALPDQISPSGSTSSTLMVTGLPPSRPFHFLGLALDILDAAAHEEGLLRVAVVLALGDRLEGPDGLLQRYEDTGLAGELLGHEHRVGQEPLDPAGPLHRHPVLLGQLVDAQDRDDVLQLGVALQDPLHLAGDSVVLLPHELRCQDPRR